MHVKDAIVTEQNATL